MVINYIAVRPDFHDPNEFFEIIISRKQPLPEFCGAVIERPGQEEAYLAANGWQANLAHLEVTLREDDISVFGLRLPRSLLRFFQPSYNYKISLFDVNQGDLGFFVIGWNPPDGVINQPSPETLQINHGSMLSPAIHPVPSQREPDEVQKTAISAQRQVIRCGDCNVEIFSTFSSCPFCGSALGW